MIIPKRRNKLKIKKSEKVMLLVIGLLCFAGLSLFSAAVVEACWSCPSDGTFVCPLDSDYTSPINCFTLPMLCWYEPCTWSYCAPPPPLPKVKCLNSGGTAEKCTENKFHCMSLSSTINEYECQPICVCNIFDPIEEYCLDGGSFPVTCTLE